MESQDHNSYQSNYQANYQDDFSKDRDEDREGSAHDLEKDRRIFARKKTCWFCAKKTSPDWKTPSTYTWLVNDFGKISPARVTGLCSKHQKRSTAAIKRGRHMLLVSHVSANVAM